MPDLSEKLRQCFQRRVCLMGLGNTEYGDDGFGVRLAEGLLEAGMQCTIVAGTMPDRFIGRLADQGFDYLVFLDAVEFTGAPGSVIFLDAGEIMARFPQISSHKISLGLLAKWVEDMGVAKACLLGVKPGSLKGAGLTPVVQTTLEILKDLLTDLWMRSKESGDAALAEKLPTRQPVAEVNV